MAHRKFIAQDGHEWEVRVRSRGEWDLEPVGSNPHRGRSVQAPGYETDPFEMSKEELQKLLDASSAPSTRSIKSPFKD
jgi:hypothetical protein